MPQWSRPIAIPNQTSKTTSSLALVQGQLHLIHLGESSDYLWHSTWNGTKWSDNVRLEVQSEGRVAFANEGLLVYRSRYAEPDGSRGLMYKLLRFGWTQAQPLPDRPTTTHSPAAVLTHGGWRVVRQVPNQDYLLAFSVYTQGGGVGVTPVEVGKETEFTAGVPALAHDANGLHTIYLRHGGKEIWHSWAGNDGAIMPRQYSRDSPAAASHNGVLHMVHIGSGSDTIWHSTFSNGRWTENVPIPDHFSGKPPAMCSAPDGLHMVHKGAGSDRIWHSIYR